MSFGGFTPPLPGVIPRYAKVGPGIHHFTHFIIAMKIIVVLTIFFGCKRQPASLLLLAHSLMLKEVQR
jgi:hypothetical protein